MKIAYINIKLDYEVVRIIKHHKEIGSRIEITENMDLEVIVSPIMK